jgi:hypothetical protein
VEEVKQMAVWGLHKMRRNLILYQTLMSTRKIDPKIRIVLLAAFTGLLLDGCLITPTSPGYQGTQTVATMGVIQTLSPVPPATETLTPLPAATNTLTVALPATLTATPNFAPQDTAEPGSNESCQPIRKMALEPNLLAEGTIILQKASGNGPLRLSALSPSTLQYRPFLDEFSPSLDSIYQSSPDRCRIAFRAQKYDAQGKKIAGDDLIVATSERAQVVVPQAGQWNQLVGWLDYKRLIVEPSYEVPFGTLLLVDPFTGNKQEIRPAFPGLSDLANMQWWNTSHTFYDPTLSRVVYLFEGTVDSYPQYRLALWNLQTRQEIWHLNIDMTSGSLAGEPTWSPDGSRFAISVPVDDGKRFQILVVNQDGKTLLTNELAFTDLTDGGFLLSEWDPTGRYLYYQLVAASVYLGTPRIYILDTQSGQMAGYCAKPYDLPQWSPDGRQLLILSRDPEQILLLDLNQKLLSQVGGLQGYAPVAWLTDPSFGKCVSQ